MAVTVAASRQVPAGGGGDLLSTLTSAEIAITTTATATIGRMHVCSGTTANYTVTLPAASGNAGKFIGLRMAPGLTKLVTIDGDASETIDGALTRVQWAEESCILLCDGSNWSKVSGKSRSMTATIQRRSTDMILPNSYTSVPLATFVSGLGLLHDTTNNRITVQRACKMNVSVFFYNSGNGTLAVGAAVNGNSNNSGQNNGYANAGASGGAMSLYAFNGLVAGDYIQAWSYGLTGAPVLLGNSVGSYASMSVTEVLEW